MRTSLLVLLAACTGGLDKYGYDSNPGQDLDSVDSGGPADTADETGAPPDENAAPVADAGDDLEVHTLDVVALDGSGSADPDGDPIDYLWVLTDAPTGSVATLINDRFVDAQFIPDVAGVYTVSLTVSDPDDLSDEDVVEIVAVDTNGDPVANAGPDQTVSPGATVYLDGSGSADPDGDSLYFAWTMTSRPGGSAAALAGGTTSAPSFVADVAGIYQVSLTVSDGANYSSADLVTVTASDGGSGGGSDCGCRAGPGGAAGALPLVVVGLAGLLGARRRR